MVKVLCHLSQVGTWVCCALVTKQLYLQSRLWPLLRCIAPQASGQHHHHSRCCHATSPLSGSQQPLSRHRALSKPKLVQAGEAPPLPVVGATVAPRHVLPRPACFYSQISQSLTLPRLICFPCSLRICHLGSVGKVGFVAAGWSGGHFLGSTVTLAVG